MKKVRRIAIRSALSLKAKEQNLVVLDELSMDKYSTKSLFGALKGEKTKLMETFPEKNNFYNEIKVFVSDYECKEMKEVINKNKANDKEIKTEKKDNNKENDEEKKKKD